MKSSAWGQIIRAAKAFIIICLCLPAYATAVQDPDLFAGDVAQYLIPLAGLALTFHYDDSEGRTEWLKNTGATIAATEVLKYSLNHTYLGKRPNGGDKGFPSGHTSSACSGSFFLAERYGWEYGAPALFIAAFTGYSRVDEGFHHWRDVIGGCALAYGISRYFVEPYHSNVVVTPAFAPRSVGVKLSYSF